MALQSNVPGMHGRSLRHEHVLQVLLDARGLKRLILSFERKVSPRVVGSSASMPGKACCYSQWQLSSVCLQLLMAYRFIKPCVRLIHMTDASCALKFTASSKRVPHAVQYKENMELRMKHASTPEKFMASELDLDEEVRRYGNSSSQQIFNISQNTQEFCLNICTLPPVQISGPCTARHVERHCGGLLCRGQQMALSK